LVLEGAIYGTSVVRMRRVKKKICRHDISANVGLKKFNVHHR
jgi:hypothetical protein